MPVTSDAWAYGVVLLAAHLLGDFVFQSERHVVHRRRPLVLFEHALIHAALAYVLIGDWRAWPIPVAVFVTHALIDAIKSRCRDDAGVFVADQLAHLLVVAALATWLSLEVDLGVGLEPAPNGRGWLALAGSGYAVFMAYVAGLVAAVEAGAHLIAKLVRPYLDELERALVRSERALGPSRGLTNAGKVIGRLERALIYLLILVGQPAGIGFLIAAKSIFRFGELKVTSNRMESEYIIIGTLASFGYAIAVTYALSALVRLVD